MKSRQEARTDNLHTANPGYVLGQLAKAFATSQSHEESATRILAVRKVEKWKTVFEGMLSGALQIGSRTPLADTPAWATLEVVQGGFATGALLAGGPLQPHEEELASRLGVGDSDSVRVAINSYFLSDAGLAELNAMLVNGCYRINVPEEGALLTVAWLLEHDNPDQARAILDAIGPFLPHLRFFPVPDTRPLTTSFQVCLQTVRQTMEILRNLKVPDRVQTEREAVLVWMPLYDRAVELFMETLDGPVPTLELTQDGKPVQSATGKYSIQGGWPCQHYPDGWKSRAQALLEDYRLARAQHQLCGKPERKGENFAMLRKYLKVCAANPKRLTGRDVGMIRFILASIQVKRGMPGSSRSREYRQAQVQRATHPTGAELSPVVAARLEHLPPDEGLNSLDNVLAPVTVEEADQFRFEVGQALAEHFDRKLRRCLCAPLDALIEMGVITSGEVLAQVIPQITAQVRAAALADPDLRRLSGATYRAFRRRRSLLLLNLSSQVKLEELPWVRAIKGYRKEGLDVQAQARQTLEEVVTQVLTAFPQQILPNKLLQEIRALADGAGLLIPIVDEVAADIFMGEFTEKYLHAAQKAGEMLEGSLYERYYGISYAAVRRIDDVKKTRGRTPTSAGFIRLCTEMAGGETSRNSWSVAHNGKIIEQEQILTTHNLAVLFDALDLRPTLQPVLEGLARRCFEWICQRNQQKIDCWKARLQMVKNTAYAWRQMIFFLSVASGNVIEPFLVWATDHLQKQPEEFQSRFRPALQGLVLATQDKTLPVSGEAQRFLGWTTEKHWLLS